MNAIKKILRIFDLIKLLLSKRISFVHPKKKDIVIFDDVRSENIIPLVKEYDFVILPVRKERIKEINLSIPLLRLMVSKFFKTKLKNNYLTSIIQLIDPKLVVTFIDNSIEYYDAAKFFNKKKFFLAIQNASRVNTLHDDHQKPEMQNRIFHQEYAHFGEWEKKIYKRNKVVKFLKVGSLRMSYAVNYFKKNKIKIDKNKFDICLVSDNAWGYDKFFNIPGLEDSWGKVYEYTLRYCKKNNKKLAFVSEEDYGNKSRYSLKEKEKEKNFYRKYLSKYKYKLIPRYAKKFTTYKHVFESKIVIAVITSVLTEALAANKKILACNFTGLKHFDLPIKESSLQDCSYEEFEKKLNKILNLSKKKYHSLLGKNKNYLIDINSYNNNAYDILKKRINKLVRG